MIGRGESVLTPVQQVKPFQEGETFDEEAAKENEIKAEEAEAAEIALIKDSQGWVFPKVKVCMDVLFSRHHVDAAYI